MGTVLYLQVNLEVPNKVGGKWVQKQYYVALLNASRVFKVSLDTKRIFVTVQSMQSKNVQSCIT